MSYNMEDPFVPYPLLDDVAFSSKIAEKTEFNETKYIGVIPENIEEYITTLTEQSYQLQPHQKFVRNFLSPNTPYNGLLLYHGLGTGKTCAAITVAEDMRDYMERTGDLHKIIVIASENVQANFKLQLFDPTKLHKKEAGWTYEGCVGDKWLKQIHITDTTTAEQIGAQIKGIIDKSYAFYGYTQFANSVVKLIQGIENKDVVKQLIFDEFNGRQIIIDEVHNLRTIEDSANKSISIYLDLIVKCTDYVRLLLLSATPMYNQCDEIVWILNVLNANDNRSTIKVADVFDAKGVIINKELLIRKMTGYISYVRGENPFTFPYRIYPHTFEKQRDATATIQLNGKKIPSSSKQIIDLYYVSLYKCNNNCGNCQRCLYKQIITNIKNISSNKFDEQDNFGYTLLQYPLQSLIISYPSTSSADDSDSSDDSSDDGISSITMSETLTMSAIDVSGHKGLRRMMNYSIATKNKFEYKPDVLEKYGRIFSLPTIQMYSAKIHHICTILSKPVDGIVLIYSQYIEGGIIPIALALEEMGYTNVNGNQLFTTPPIKPNGLKYTMITGDSHLSPDNVASVATATHSSNINGEVIKIIILSRAGSEGVDFKYIRQVHIFDPWYNMNRQEQIIGRAVRNGSHLALPFAKRNVMIYLYACTLDELEETVDEYMYRVAGKKAVGIGEVTRLLKETSIDCVLHYQQNNFTQEMMNQKVSLLLSNGQKVNYKVGDEPYSSICDYMKSCKYKAPSYKLVENKDTYNESFFVDTVNELIHHIKNMFGDGYFYHRDGLMDTIRGATHTNYLDTHFYFALHHIVHSEYVVDKYGRKGTVVNIGDYYLFQPIELTDPTVSVFERMVPIAYKNKYIRYELREVNTERTSTAPQIITELTTHVNNCLTRFTEKTDSSWYLHFKLVFARLDPIFTNTTAPLNSYKLFILVAHFVDLLSHQDKLVLLQYVSFKQFDKDAQKIEYLCKRYLEKNELHIQGFNLHLLFNGTKLVWIYKTETEWMFLEPADQYTIEKSPSYTDAINTQVYNERIGFYGYDKTGSFLVYKTVNLTKKRDTGARCSEAGRKKNVDLLMDIGKLHTIPLDSFNSVELCVLWEIVLRYFDLVKEDGKKWMLTPELALFHKIYKITV